MADYLTPEWNQDVPSEGAVVDALRRIAIEVAPIAAGPLTRLVEQFRGIYQYGGAEFARFQLGFDPTVHWYGSRNRFQDVALVDRLITQPTVRGALPVAIPIDLPKPLELEWGSAFTLDGELARCLHLGGAYHRFVGTPTEAKEIAAEAVRHLLQDRFDEVQIYRTFDPWTSWFKDIAWDVTWFGFDKRDGTFWVLALTDED